jgi:hypothetical protein
MSPRSQQTYLRSPFEPTLNLSGSFPFYHHPICTSNLLWYALPRTFVLISRKESTCVEHSPRQLRSLPRTLHCHQSYCPQPARHHQQLPPPNRPGDPDLARGFGWLVDTNHRHAKKIVFAFDEPPGGGDPGDDGGDEPPGPPGVDLRPALKDLQAALAAVQSALTKVKAERKKLEAPVGNEEAGDECSS